MSQTLLAHKCSRHANSEYLPSVATSLYTSVEYQAAYSQSSRKELHHVQGCCWRITLSCEQRSIRSGHEAQHSAICQGRLKDNDDKRAPGCYQRTLAYTSSIFDVQTLRKRDTRDACFLMRHDELSKLFVVAGELLWEGERGGEGCYLQAPQGSETSGSMQPAQAKHTSACSSVTIAL